VTLASDELAIEAIKLPKINITTTNNKTAEPRNDAKNVLKNDFIFYEFII
jgi:hypothetical protein